MEDKILPVQIDFLLDEFANCPPFLDPSIEKMVSVARSRGMRFHLYIQSFSQLDSVYGKDIARSVLDNCGLCYLKTNTQETAESISKRLGYKTLESNSILRATYIPTEATLVEGDSVETSGMGGIYPKGIHIGTIQEVVNTNNITDRYAKIKTAVDFSSIQTVLVIKN